MPEIARFYGIIIQMFAKPKEHEPSHIHAVYDNHKAVFNIRTFEIEEGDMPRRAKGLVVEWLTLHKDELQKMWDTQTFTKLPPLD